MYNNNTQNNPRWYHARQYFLQISWNPQCIDFRFLIPSKVAGISEEHGTRADFSDYFCYIPFSTKSSVTSISFFKKASRV